ncbi:MAG: hypothetical protein HY814_13085 [Candidatus Riflebacteria bacterium]|nr:hypothetical protein [Candidatus Riflebacteria bacterium]
MKRSPLPLAVRLQVVFRCAPFFGAILAPAFFLLGWQRLPEHLLPIKVAGATELCLPSGKHTLYLAVSRAAAQRLPGSLRTPFSLEAGTTTSQGSWTPMRLTTYPWHASCENQKPETVALSAYEDVFRLSYMVGHPVYELELGQPIRVQFSCRPCSSAGRTLLSTSPLWLGLGPPPARMVLSVAVLPLVILVLAAILTFIPYVRWIRREVDAPDAEMSCPLPPDSADA